MSELITWTFDEANRNKFIVGGSVNINYSAKALWELLTTTGHLTKVHPRCERHETTSWVGIGSKDIVTYKNGGYRNRTVIDWDVEKKIRVIVQDPSNQKESKVLYSIKKLTDQSCELLIQIETDAYKNIPRPIWKLYAITILRPQYKKYLGGLLLGFVNYTGN